MIIHHIFLCFPACKPFYIASLFKLLWEKLHQISQTLNIVFQIEYYTKSEKDTNFSDIKTLTNMQLKRPQKCSDRTVFRAYIILFPL